MTVFCSGSAVRGEDEIANTNEVLRVSAAAYGIVKLTVEGEPRYLLQRNAARGSFNFLSGHVEADVDEGYFVRTMAREATEELEAAGFSPNDLALRPLPTDLYTVDRDSARYPGLTRYVFKLYQLFFSATPTDVYAQALRDPLNAWFSLEELRAGRSAAGHPVTKFPVPQLLEAHGGLFEDLPQSTPFPVDLPGTLRVREVLSGQAEPGTGG